MSDTIGFQTVVASNLGDGEINRIYEIEQDMWAREEGLGEYLRCISCETVYSKQDIYDKKDKKIYNMTVADIEQMIGSDIPNCTCCGGRLEHVFGRKNYIPEMINRYSGRVHMVVMLKNEEVIGFMDGHLSNFDTIFDRDLAYRYDEEGKQDIKTAIEVVLGKIPDIMFSCSSMGTTQSFMSFHHIYPLLQNFFNSFPQEFDREVGFSELHVGGSLEKIYSGLGAERIKLDESKYNTNQEGYDSGIFIQRELGKTYRDGFSKDFRMFLKERAMRKSL